MASAAVARRPAVGVQGAVPLAVAAAAIYVVAVAWGASAWSYDVWAAVVVAPVLTLGTFALAKGIAVRAGDPTVVTLVMMGWVVKLAGSLLRWWVAFHLSDRADSRVYDEAGRAVGELFRQGSFDLDYAPVVPGSTGVIQVASGVVYAITGPSSLAGFFVFAWGAYLGAMLLWRAFVLAVPQGDHRRYGLLVLLLPSLAYWPSSLGKDAWMVLSLGIASYGAARVLTRRRGGLVVLAAGCAVGALVRPHVMLLVGGAMTAAWIVGRTPRQARSRWLVRVVGSVVLVAACVALFVRLQHEFEGKIDDDVGSLLDFTNLQTSQGGSAFVASRVSTPLDVPWATVTVLVRPFPFEADNAQALASAGEGVLLAVFLAVSWRRIVSSLRAARRLPYLLLCATYSLGFVVAFSSVGNFGILARQRVQILPFVVALACLQRDHHVPRAASHD